MDERSIIKVQVQSVLDQLKWLKAALGRHSINSRIYRGALTSLENEVEKKHYSLTNVQADVQNDKSLETCWVRFEACRQECAPIFAECLAYLEGVLARKDKVDGGLCEIADALLYEVSARVPIPWQRFTILEVGDVFVEMAQIIRVRFPEVSLWNLPIAGHEFGHFLGQRLEVLRTSGKYRSPFHEILEREVNEILESKDINEQQEVRYLHEHFADMFATYVLGPSYVCTCILLRFDPKNALDDGAQHPAQVKRVHLMLKTLQKMASPSGQFDAIVETLRTLWQKCLVATGHTQFLEEKVVLNKSAELECRFQGLYDLLVGEFPLARYSRWARAIDLATECENEETVVRRTDEIRDVLNAVWLCRYRQWESSRRVARLGERAVDLCRDIIIRRELEDQEDGDL
jgi:hypothetical protein